MSFFHSVSSYGKLAKLLLSFIICIAVFPDVVFLKTSFRPSEIEPHTNYTSTKRLYFDRKDRRVYNGYNDIGTSVWGLEPGQFFLNKCIKEGESPFWNPYSAAGSLGVESMTDSKFSIFSIINAIFGPSSNVYHFSYLAILSFSIYFLLSLLHKFFYVGALGGGTAGIVFLLNGFHLSNLTNILIHPYLLSPFLLYQFLSLNKEPTRLIYFLGLTIATTLFILTLFPATAILMMGSIVVFVLFYSYSQGGRLKDLSRLSFYYLASVLLGCLLASPILLPTIHSWTYLNTFKEYVNRVYPSVSYLALFSIFSPKHFWESYNAFFTYNPQAPEITWAAASWVHHIGLSSALIAMQALSFPIKKAQIAHYAAFFLVLLAALRAFNQFPFSIFSHVPIFQSIQPGYWNCITGFFTSILVALGMRNLQTKVDRISFSLSAALIGTCLARLIIHFKFPSQRFEQAYLIIDALVSLVVCGTFFLIKYRPRWTQVLRCVLCLVLFSEMIFYMNTTRPVRSSEKSLLAQRQVLLDRLSGDYRTLSIGRDVLPPEWGSKYRIRQAEGFRESTLPWYQNFFIKSFGQPNQGLSFGSSPQEVPLVKLPLASYLGVRYFLVSRSMVAAVKYFDSMNLSVFFEDEKVKVFENTEYFERVRLYRTLRQGEVPQGAQLAELRDSVFSNDHELLRLAQLSHIGSYQGTESEERRARSRSFIKVLETHHGAFVMESLSEEATVLSVAESWHMGWKAYCDKQPIYVGRINDAFLGLILPPGKHQVELVYEPFGLKQGVLMVACVLLGSLSFILYKMRKKTLSKAT